jgi:tetratricopeptide (TPR) repeat protein
MDYYQLMLRLNRFPLFIALVLVLNANAQTRTGQVVAPVNSTLSSGLFYQLLLGEMNAREGGPGAAYSLILDAARKTGDAKLYQRAVDIALQARSGDSALLAARAWRQALPTSKEANQYVLQILIGLNRIAETLEPLKRKIAAANPKDRAAAIAAIARYFAGASDKKLAATIVEQALNDYLAQPIVGVSAWVVIGQMHLAAGDSSKALDAARKAQALDAKAEAPVLLALSMMSAQMPQAEALVRKYLEGESQPDVRMEYARALLDVQRYAEALKQVQLITTEKPDYLQAWLMTGILELQNGKPVAAEQTLKHYVELTVSNANGTSRAAIDRGLTQAYLSLAQISEQRKDFAAADAWLKRIERSEDLLSAQLRRAALLGHQGKLEEARELIHSQPEKSQADARIKVAAEIELLRDSKRYQDAYQLLAQASARNPDDFDLVYDQAMVAEKLGHLEEMEHLLRNVIAGQPTHPQAYNALGYALAEHNTRLAEAKQLILKALEYAPGDPFITDSLGWIEFRSGNLAQAELILAGAYKARPDAEIAAHLGEVLWTMARQEDAKRTWKEGLQINAENETLLETLKRLRVKL